MRYAVIGDSREWSEPRSTMSASGHVIEAADVESEARRRKRLLRIDEWEMRQFVTDRPVPEHIRQVCAQIDLAAAALARLSPIPLDYADDLYWPRVW